MVATNTSQATIASSSTGVQQQTQKSAKSDVPSPSKAAFTMEKDTEEYKRLRERNNEAVKKSRTKTKLRTQKTLDKVEKLRGENTKLEEKISGLKKELDLLKELFISHAGTASIKRLTEGDLDTLIAEAMPKNKKKKGTTYTGRDREIIEKEVLELLGKDGFVLETLPSTSAIEDEDSSNQMTTEAEDTLDGTTANISANDGSTLDSTSAEDQTIQSTLDDTAAHHQETDTSEYQASALAEGDVDQTQVHLEAAVDGSAEAIAQAYAVQQDQMGETTYAIVADGAVVGPAFWTTENGETVVVTIEDDGSGNLIASGVPVQQDISDIIQGEILMLE